VIRVVAADDHPAYLRATTETLRRAGLRVVGVSTSGQGVIDFVRDSYPGTHVVILSAYDDREIVQLAIAAGATGYVSKDSPPEEIVRAVCRAADGEPTLPFYPG
jgi:two-component system nitrate/nitrite response regulator NarL